MRGPAMPSSQPDARLYREADWLDQHIDTLSGVYRVLSGPDAGVRS